MSGDSKFAGRGKRGKGGAVAEDTADAPAVAPDDDGIEEQEYQPTEADGGMFGDVPAKKAKNFWPSAKRLFGLLKPEAAGVWFVVVLVVISVVLNVIAPKVLGKAMDVIFAGVIGKPLPADVTKDQVVQGLRASGQNNFADMVSKMDLVPGQGIDFQQLSFLIASVLLMYFAANLFLWAQGYILNRIVMKVVRRLRDDTEAKLNRLPLNYFDTRQRGDILSRVTNDVDNVQQGLQQAVCQLVCSVRTVFRDINVLSSSGIPVYYDDESKGNHILGSPVAVRADPTALQRPSHPRQDKSH